MSGAYGDKLGDSVGVKSPPTIEARLLQTADFMTTHLAWEERDSEAATRIGREDAFLVFLQRRAIPANPYWIDGKPVDMKPLDRGQFLLLDLHQEHQSIVRAAVDCLAFYVPRASLDLIAEENETRRPITLRASFGDPIDDPVIWHLGECLLPALHQGPAINRLFIDHVSLAMVTHLAARHGEAAAWPTPRRSALAAWQERRAKDMLLANMDGKIGLEELARNCGLSRAHFARAFKATTGLTPMRWLFAQRIERAKSLLLNSALPIDEIAHYCGFADQSHFTRAFSGAVGDTPGAWRRSRKF
ncbi:MAG: helix-turn-helix transcriptional regulator [Chelatococcus sp.]|jgi:AraC family transcriptional regulator|uniref:AraC family transcriptional regulator n=1 Tax=Parvibaculum sp. TaxID=2024848 RepID=UPI001BCC9AE8|nr:AraC family transcriptional regulator [Parvibaculum sp.]MBS7741415.1 helix-turn-helix transcriptional regulator [Chelatococcus sp. HY11]MBX3546103.1 helix-turn-helix transcriptional regulator [Chelatococcus sp.]CAH1662698.1 Transcriptional regulator [Hyphomicrobiales bacterium]MBX3491220.1 helix-turn-helix transcriptional regulator [Parvibaculum sp.]CAH1682574.1 Transcriptional regulator [Hyphomicrobiales bacterium]